MKMKALLLGSSQSLMVIAALVGVTLVATQTRAEDWVQWRGNDRRAIWTEEGILDELLPRNLAVRKGSRNLTSRRSPKRRKDDWSRACTEPASATASSCGARRQSSRRTTAGGCSARHAGSISRGNMVSGAPGSSSATTPSLSIHCAPGRRRS